MEVADKSSARNYLKNFVELAELNFKGGFFFQRKVRLRRNFFFLTELFSENLYIEFGYVANFFS